MEILLLTNRDSDNVGDQVIEASDIALVNAAMKNLGIAPSDYKISSRAAAIITQKYIASKDPALLVTAENAIKKADLIIFGGAPLFNYTYQTFYERTSIEIELAQKYNKPVIFSAIGIEHYDEDNAKCQRLKAALNLDCVKQITTRDGYDKLEKFRSREDIVIGKVADPAVFSGKIFDNFKMPKKKNSKKKIGIFVLRANGFKDNKYDFHRDQAAALWKDLTNELENRGYDYELITSGHFGDEAFVHYLIQNYGINASKCVFNINLPETLLARISSYDGVISCRLHPSIISFSLGIPSIGLEWNNKVGRFYENINYPDRVIQVEDLSAPYLVDKIEQAMDAGVQKDEDYLLTVYTTLFNGIKNGFRPDDTTSVPYTYDELLDNLPLFAGTSENETNEKLKRKFRRTYLKYNELAVKSSESKVKIAHLESQVKKLKKQVSTQKKEIAAQKQEISTQKKEIAALKSTFFRRACRWLKRKLKRLFKK